MSRIMAIDYGTKRVGIAITDPLKIIASSLTTIHSKDIIAFIQDYDKKENIECLVVGQPIRLNNKVSDNEQNIIAFLNRLKKIMPKLKVERVNERFTSKMAVESLVQSGTTKKQRQNKALIDEVSATIILQSFLEGKKA